MGLKEIQRQKGKSSGNKTAEACCHRENNE
jgi:hypothetical protein